jgi:heptosyltransferase-2
MKGKIELDRIKRLLVRGVNWVGDTILTYPSVQQLRILFPQSYIAILVPDYLVDLWRTFPYIDEIISFRKGRKENSFLEELRLIQFLKSKNFDLAIIFPRSFHSALQTFLAGIPIRIGYQSEGRSLFLTHRIPRTEDVLRIHRVYYYRKIIELFGKGEPILNPKLFLREEDRRWADQTLKNFGILNGDLLIGMNPGATYGGAKCWSPKRFGELGKKLSERLKVKILLFGKKEEQSIGGQIGKNLGTNGLDFTGKTSLLQLAALLERCHLLITNDTGTMHIAAAVGTPVIALFGSTDPNATGPWGENHVIVRKEVPCSPCLKRICPTDHRCMNLITIDEVEKAVHKKLEELNINQ